MLSYVELFQGRLRDYIQDGLTRGTKYLPMIQNVFRAEGLPLDLAYIPIIESGFKPNALSKANAKGPWQFMKATASRTGLHHDWYIDERSDPGEGDSRGGEVPEDAVQAVRRRLEPRAGGLQRRSRPGAARDEACRQGGFLGAVRDVPLPARRKRANTCRSSSRRSSSPRTRRSTGSTSAPQEPVAYDKVTVPRAIDLRRVAEWTGQTIDEIQALNPELRRWTTPVK